MSARMPSLMSRPSSTFSSVPGTACALPLFPPPTQQVPTQQQILSVECEDRLRDRTVVAGRLQLLDVLRPVGRASSCGPGGSWHRSSREPLPCRNNDLAASD